MATYSVPQEGLPACLPVNVSRTLMRATGRDLRRHKASRRSAGRKSCRTFRLLRRPLGQSPAGRQISEAVGADASNADNGGQDELGQWASKFPSSNGASYGTTSWLRATALADRPREGHNLASVLALETEYGSRLCTLVRNVTASSGNLELFFQISSKFV